MVDSTLSTLVGFMPLLGHGDLLYNAFVLRNHMFEGTTPDETVMDVRGTHGKALHAFGDGAECIVPRVFGPNASTRNALMHHTLLGAYCRAMSQVSESACINSKARRRSTDVTRHLGLRQGARALTTSSLRYCRRCVESDTDQRGFATWRVLHQIRSVGRCPTHGDLLVDEGESLRSTSDGTKPAHFRLPGESGCEAPNNPLPMSEGYAAYLELWRLVFDGELPVMRPEPWRELMGNVVVRLGGTQQALYAIEQVIESTWELPVATLDERLSLDGGASFVEAELALVSRPKDLARRLIVYAAARHAGVITEEHEQFALVRSRVVVTNPHPGAAAPQQDLYRELWEIVASKGYPIALVEALLENVREADAARMCGLTPGMISLLVRRVPETTLLKLATKAGDVPRTSWIGRELTRRHLSVSTISSPGRPD